MVSKLQEVELLDLHDEYTRLNLFEPLVYTEPTSRFEPISPSHSIDRHPINANFFQWCREVSTFVTMCSSQLPVPPRLATSHSNPPSFDQISDARPMEATATNEQIFRWTFIVRLTSGKGDYREISRRPRTSICWNYGSLQTLGLSLADTGSPRQQLANPSYAYKAGSVVRHEEISLADIEARIDPPTNVDKIQMHLLPYSWNMPMLLRRLVNRLTI